MRKVVFLLAVALAPLFCFSQETGVKYLRKADSLFSMQHLDMAYAYYGAAIMNLPDQESRGAFKNRHAIDVIYREIDRFLASSDSSFRKKDTATAYLYWKKAAAFKTMHRQCGWHETMKAWSENKPHAYDCLELLYNERIAMGDSLYRQKEYLPALICFDEARRVLPDNTLAIQKIVECQAALKW